MKTPSTPLRRWLLLVSLGLATGCPGEPTDTGSPVETDSDVQDTDPCPGAPEKQPYIDTHLQDLCTWWVSCPDAPYETVQECVEIIGGGFTSRPCWQRCSAAACIDWVAQQDGCETTMDLPQVCSDMPTCDD